MRHYKHLSTKERECLLILRKIGKTITEIAKELNRSKSTISRELKRNSNEGERTDHQRVLCYAAHTARYRGLHQRRALSCTADCRRRCQERGERWRVHAEQQCAGSLVHTTFTIMTVTLYLKKLILFI